MREIKFDREWDKLKPEMFIKGEVFTTLREYTPKKETFYEENAGKNFDVVLKGKKIGVAQLVFYEIMRPSDIHLKLLQLDTFSHYFRKDIKLLFKEYYNNPDPICFYLYFKIIEVYEREE